MTKSFYCEEQVCEECDDCPLTFVVYVKSNDILENLENEIGEVIKGLTPQSRIFGNTQILDEILGKSSSYVSIKIFESQRSLVTKRLIEKGFIETNED